MTKTLIAMLVAVATLFAVGARAQEAHDATERGKAAAHADSAAGETRAAHGTAGVAHDEAGGHAGGPVLPPAVNPRWVGVVLILIMAMFVMAAVVGPLARMHAPPAEVLPPTHSHDEPPGASHHHGASGTINPEPDHGHHGHH